jgi:hypothetical protein
MSEGPSREEIDRVREALERHDSELREDQEPQPDEAQAPADDSDEDDDG